MTILWPLDSVSITGDWGNSPDFYAQFGQVGHNGIDMVASIGTPVYATDDGYVVTEGWGKDDNWMGTIAGISVRLKHWWGYSAYAHLSSTIVDAGQQVKRGQKIAYSGNTGVGTGPHLHFETFPEYPNFGNGFSGRVNPRVWGLEFRGTDSNVPETTDGRNPVKYITGYNSKSNNPTRQALKAGGDTQWLHTNDKGHSALVTGKGQYSITVTVDLSGKPGDRVVLNSYRVNREGSKDTALVFLDEIDIEILPNGRVRRQIVIDNVLRLPTERIRVQLRTAPGASKVTVTRASWRGYQWDL